MEIKLSTSTKLEVLLSPTIKLCGQRHSDRRSGASVWHTWFEKFGKWEVHDNPFDRKDFHIEEKWGIVKGTTYKGICLAKRWGYKKEIITELNKIGS